MTGVSVGSNRGNRSITEPGAMIAAARPSFLLHVEKPADVWCKPSTYVYDGDGGVGDIDLPNVNLPNPDKPWICRKVRWC